MSSQGLKQKKQLCGFLLLDKLKGVVSFDVVRRLRRILQVRRIGYAGTLDPLASGLMIVAVGEATKILHHLEKMDKTYDVTIRFGATSQTYDAEGPITIYDLPRIFLRADLEKVLHENFTGEQMQAPPSFSAVKVDGVRSYKKARRGEEVRVAARKVFFHDIKIKNFQYPDLQCFVACGSGTYIRSFAHDLGQKLHCGAYVQDLRRIKIGEHSIADAVPLEKISAENFQEFLLPPHEFLKTWRKIILNSAQFQKLAQGGFLQNDFKLESELALAIFENKTVGLLESCMSGAAIKFAKKFNLS